MRQKIEIVQVRSIHVEAGDVVNRRGAEARGWIEVDRVEHLENGSYVVHDKTQRDSFTAEEFDLVWMQLTLAMPEYTNFQVQSF